MFAKALENPRLIGLFSALIIVAGLAALAALPTMEDPRVLNRVATVLTAYPGATPERVEALVTEPLEDALRTLPEVDVISSSSQAGVSVIRVELKDSVTDTAPVWSEARDKLADAQPELPDGALTSRLNDDRGYAFTRLLAVTWAGAGEPNLLIIGRYADALAQRLRGVRGMDLVERYGEPEEEVLVTIDPVAAARAGLSVTEAARAVGERDAKVSAGQLRGGEREWLMEVSGELDSLQALGDTVLRETPDGRALRLHDVADLRRAQREPPSELALVDGRPAVVLGARMLPDEQIEAWNARVDRVLEDFSAQLPTNMALSTLFDQQRYTSERLGGLVGNILAGFAVILAVLFLTLGWRAALLVALALPLTVAFTLAGLRVAGLPIHQMTVTGLVVALGIMVDNAIVMTDTIQRLRREGASRGAAVAGGLRRLWLPLAGSTLTTILAFMPIALMPGPSGEFVGGIAISVIFALVGSYLVSHTIVAGLAGRFLRPDDRHRGVSVPAVAAAFDRSLRWSLAHPRVSIAAALVLPFAGYLAAGQMTEQFFPPSDRNMFTIELHLDPASGISATRERVRAVDEVLSEAEGIESVQWFLGKSAPPFYYNMMQRYDETPQFAQAMVTTRDFEAANRALPALQRKLDDRFPDGQALVRKLEQGPPFGAPVELRIYGPSLDTLTELGDELRRIALETEDVVHVRTTLSRGRPKVRLVVDENRVRRAGLAPVLLADELQAALDGIVGGSILEATEDVPVRLRLGGDSRDAPEDLYRLHLAGAGAEAALNLASLGELRFEPAAGVITRRAGQRVNTVELYLRSGVLPAAVQARMQERLQAAALRLPPGYRLEFAGEGAERDAAVGNLLGSVGLILTLLVAAVVLSFNSFRLSSVVFAVAALAPGLGLLCVWAAGYPFGFVVIIGLMGLVGLAINAAIVILAELRGEAEAAAGDVDAIVAGVLNCTRHIVSTTLTTLGGFLPLILGGGGFWPPFAIAIAGGTLLTSILSFYLVPAAFRLYALRRSFAPAPGLVAG